MNFKKWVKSIQTAGYNGARTVIQMISAVQHFIIIPQNCDNWLEEWWLKKAYLQFRDPLLPFLNTAGPFAANNPGQNWVK